MSRGRPAPAHSAGTPTAARAPREPRAPKEPREPPAPQATAATRATTPHAPPGPPRHAAHRSKRKRTEAQEHTHKRTHAQAFPDTGGGATRSTHTNGSSAAPKYNLRKRQRPTHQPTNSRAQHTGQRAPPNQTAATRPPPPQTNQQNRTNARNATNASHPYYTRTNARTARPKRGVG